MSKEIQWWMLGLAVFGLVFFFDLMLVLIVLLAPLAVAALGFAVIGAIINAWINQAR